MALEREWEAFCRELPGLLANPENVGKYALIHGEKMDSLWPSRQEAIAAGYERFNIEPFLVQHVIEKEAPKFFTRSVVPWQESKAE